MKISIWGRYRGKKPEKLDTASDPYEALYLVKEYKLAFGRDWEVWAGSKQQNSDREMQCHERY